MCIRDRYGEIDISLPKRKSPSKSMGINQTNCFSTHSCAGSIYLCHLQKTYAFYRRQHFGDKCLLPFFPTKIFYSSVYPQIFRQASKKSVSPVDHFSSWSTAANALCTFLFTFDSHSTSAFQIPNCSPAPRSFPL